MLRWCRAPSVLQTNRQLQAGSRWVGGRWGYAVASLLPARTRGMGSGAFVAVGVGIAKVYTQTATPGANWPRMCVHYRPKVLYRVP